VERLWLKNLILFFKRSNVTTRSARRRALIIQPGSRLSRAPSASVYYFIRPTVGVGERISAISTKCKKQNSFWSLSSNLFSLVPIGFCFFRVCKIREPKQMRRWGSLRVNENRSVLVERPFFLFFFQLQANNHSLITALLVVEFDFKSYSFLIFVIIAQFVYFTPFHFMLFQSKEFSNLLQK